MRQRGTSYLMVLVAALALITPYAGSAHAAPRTSEPSADRPNIVLITADDMRLADLAWMPLTRARFAALGMEFRNGFAPHPLCCPARAQILTGQYAHNNGVLTNQGVFGGFHSLRDPGNTIGAWLQAAGYTTGFVGKYLNGYSWTRHGPQAGWTSWDPTIGGVYGYTSFTQAANGNPREVHDGYITDYVARASTDLIEDASAADQPFFLWASYIAPHRAIVPGPDGRRVSTPPIPAPGDVGRYAGVTPDVWDDPAYDEPDLSDKPSTLDRGRVDDQGIQTLFTARIESLVALDEAVDKTFAALAESGALAHTMVVFTSDNGFLLGQHRYVGKSVAYEESVRVPFLVAAPSLPAGTVSRRTVALIDLAPTFLAAAGGTPGRVLDGHSFLHSTPQDPAGRTLLVQAGNNGARGGDRRWNYRGIRSPRYTYVRWYTGERELYDRRRDPDQLWNKAGNRRYRDVVAWAQRVSHRLERCAGASCRREPPPAPQIR